MGICTHTLILWLNLLILVVSIKLSDNVHLQREQTRRGVVQEKTARVLQNDASPQALEICRRLGAFSRKTASAFSRAILYSRRSNAG